MTTKKGPIDSRPTSSSSSNVNSKKKTEYAEHERLQKSLEVVSEREQQFQDVLVKLDVCRPGSAQGLKHLDLASLIKTYEIWAEREYIWIPPSEPIEEESEEKALNLDDEEQESVDDEIGKNKIVNSGADNFGNSTGDNKEEEGGKPPRKIPKTGLPATAPPPLSSSSSEGQTPLNPININKRVRTASEESVFCDSVKSGDPPVTQAEPPKKGATKPTAATKVAAAAALLASAKKGSASAAAGDNPKIPKELSCLEVKRVQDTLALCDRIAKEHTIESAYEVRGFTGKATDYKPCEMCIDNKIGNGRATSVCLGCSVITHPQELYYVCWDHSLQHGMEVFKARYCQQCFREGQDDGNV